MFEFLNFELIVHDSAGGVLFRVVTWIITVIIGAVPALCARCAKTPPMTTSNLLGVASDKSEDGLSREHSLGSDDLLLFEDSDFVPISNEGTTTPKNQARP